MCQFSQNMITVLSGSQRDPCYHPRVRVGALCIDVIDFHQRPIHVLTDAPQLHSCGAFPRQSCPRSGNESTEIRLLRLCGCSLSLPASFRDPLAPVSHTRGPRVPRHDDEGTEHFPNFENLPNHMLVHWPACWPLLK